MIDRLNTSASLYRIAPCLNHSINEIKLYFFNLDLNNNKQTFASEKNVVEHKKLTFRPHQVKAIVNALPKVKVMVIDVLMMSQVESETLKVNYIS